MLDIIELPKLNLKKHTIFNNGIFMIIYLITIYCMFFKIDIFQLIESQ